MVLAEHRVRGIRAVWIGPWLILMPPAGLDHYTAA